MQNSSIFFSCEKSVGTSVVRVYIARQTFFAFLLSISLSPSTRHAHSMFLSTAYGDEHTGGGDTIATGIRGSGDNTSKDSNFSPFKLDNGDGTIVLYDSNGNAILCDISQVNIQPSIDGHSAIITPLDKARHRKRSSTSATGKPLGRPKTIKDAPEKLTQQTMTTEQDILDAKAVLERQSSKRKSKQPLLMPPPPPPQPQLLLNLVAPPPPPLPPLITSQSNNISLLQPPQPSSSSSIDKSSKKKHRHNKSTTTIANVDDDDDDSIWTFVSTPHTEIKRGRKPKTSTITTTKASKAVVKKRKSKVALEASSSDAATLRPSKKHKKHRHTTAIPTAAAVATATTEGDVIMTPSQLEMLDSDRLLSMLHAPPTPPPTPPPQHHQQQEQLTPAFTTDDLAAISDADFQQMCLQQPELLYALLPTLSSSATTTATPVDDNDATMMALLEQHAAATATTATDSTALALPHDSMFIENKHKRDVLFSKRFKTLVQKSHLLHAMTRYRVFLVTQTQNIDDYHVVLPNLPKSGQELKQAFDSHLRQLEVALDTLRSMDSSRMSPQEILKNQHLAIMMGNMSQILFNPETTVTFEDSSNPTHQSSKRKPRFEHNDHRPHITTPYLGRIVDDPIFLKSIETPAATSTASVHVRGLQVHDHHETSYIINHGGDNLQIMPPPPQPLPQQQHTIINDIVTDAASASPPFVRNTCDSIVSIEEDGTRIILPAPRQMTLDGDGEEEQDAIFSYNPTNTLYQQQLPLIEEPSDEQSVLWTPPRSPPRVQQQQQHLSIADIRQDYMDILSSSSSVVSPPPTSLTQFEKSFQTVQGFDAQLYNLPQSIPNAVRTETTVTTTTKTTLLHGDKEFVRIEVDKIRSRKDFRKILAEMP